MGRCGVVKSKEKACSVPVGETKGGFVTLKGKMRTKFRMKYKGSVACEGHLGVVWWLFCLVFLPLLKVSGKSTTLRCNQVLLGFLAMSVPQQGLWGVWRVWE